MPAAAPACEVRSAASILLNWYSLRSVATKRYQKVILTNAFLFEEKSSNGHVIVISRTTYT
ncbi:hypothetical protein XU18_5009 [Perkinsela sp. CCAP 1560/4]|nr:hypothetical protein XU18_5009 [Perkinsela sp. CCAP 1560/4]|eukprot:KNH00518.1 hypothetical protein XU18_5009 [Perkinsela sp. CCAP 1560/4]